MQVDTYYPIHPLLKKHIAYYYFLRTDSSNFKTAYYAFPHVLQSLNIHKNITCTIAAHCVKIKGCKKNNYTMLLQGKYEQPLQAEQSGIIDKVTILFKPVGLNHFITKPLKEIAGEPTQFFTEWDNEKDHDTFLQEFYATINNEERIQVLETYLLGRYTIFAEAAALKTAVKLLTDFNNKESSIDEIAKQLLLNTRTFNRLFQKHMGITPVGFRKIARFRHSLKNKLFNTHFKTLTQIGYGSNFYDQSYFIKIYKEITGQNPSRFFNSIEKLADSQLILKFMNK